MDRTNVFLINYSHGIKGLTHITDTARTNNVHSSC